MTGKERPWLPDFKIAFTFTGEYREKIVRPVCEELLKYGYSEEDIFFDEWHPELFTGVNADSIFREIYHDVSQCVVVLLSPNYGDKLWTGNLEWPTVRALINEGTHHKICLLRVDDVDINKIEGLYASRDVARPVDKMTSAQIARFIHRWYCIHVLKQSPDAGKAKTDPVPKEPSKPEPAAKSKKTETAPAPMIQTENVVDRWVETGKAAVEQFFNGTKADPPVVHDPVDTAPNDNKLEVLENGNVLFGSYPQTAEGERRPIEWLVLKREKDRALLISRYALDAYPYNSCAVTTWADCSLRSWLNGRRKEDFPQAAFTAEERKQILLTEVPADKNPRYQTSPGEPTKDKLFLLSIPEANVLFSSDQARRCAPTDYAKKQRAYTGNYLNVKVEGKPACWWWLRSPGCDVGRAACVSSDGSVNERGGSAYFDDVSVRPALWIYWPDSIKQ